MAHKEHVTETPDTSYIKNVDVTHEVSDVYIGGIVKFVIALTVLMVASFVLMWALFRVLESKSTDPERSPMALSDKDRLPAEPRLQGAPGFGAELEKTTTNEKKPEPAHEGKPTPEPPKDPMWEIQVLKQHWGKVLKEGPVDQNGTRYGMPIDKAKEEVLKQLPVRQEGRKQ